MQLEQQENFTIHGPQLEILGEIETKLPAPAKKRGTASIVLAALALVSVLGIGGAKLKGVYRETAEIYTSAQDEYGHSIQEILRRRPTRRRTSSNRRAMWTALRRLLYRKPRTRWPRGMIRTIPAVQYAANRRLYNAVDTLYASLNNKVDDSTSGRWMTSTMRLFRRRRR